MKKVDVGIVQVGLIWDVLQIVKFNDYQILREHGFEWEVKEGFMETWIHDLLDNFCEPLLAYDKDTEIILEV